MTLPTSLDRFKWMDQIVFFLTIGRYGVGYEPYTSFLVIYLCRKRQYSYMGE